MLWKMVQQILHSRGKMLLLPCCGFFMPKSSQFKWFKWFVFVLFIWPWNTFWRRRDLTKSRSYFHCDDYVKGGSKSFHFAKVINCDRFEMKAPRLWWPTLALFLPLRRFVTLKTLLQIRPTDKFKTLIIKCHYKKKNSTSKEYLTLSLILMSCSKPNYRKFFLIFHFKSD